MSWGNSIMVKENFVSYIPLRAHDDLADTIMNPANWPSSTVNHSLKVNITSPHPEPIYVYTDIIKSKLVGDSYLRLLTSLHFPLAKGHHRLDFPLYKPVEQYYIVNFDSSSYENWWNSCFKRAIFRA